MYGEAAPEARMPAEAAAPEQRRCLQGTRRDHDHWRKYLKRRPVWPQRTHAGGPSATMRTLGEHALRLRVALGDVHPQEAVAEREQLSELRGAALLGLALRDPVDVLIHSAR